MEGVIACTDKLNSYWRPTSSPTISESVNTTLRCWIVIQPFWAHSMFVFMNFMKSQSMWYMFLLLYLAVWYSCPVMDNCPYVQVGVSQVSEGKGSRGYFQRPDINNNMTWELKLGVKGSNGLREEWEVMQKWEKQWILGPIKVSFYFPIPGIVPHI